MCCPGPHHRESDSLEGLRQVQNQSHCPLPQNIPSPTEFHTVCWASPLLPSAASQSTRYFSCHFATSGALKASRQRISVGISAIGLSFVTFFGIKKNIVVHACCGHFPLCPTFSKNSTTSPIVSFVKSKGNLWGGSRHILLLSLLCTLPTLFPIHTLFTTAAHPPISSVPHSSKVCPPHSAPPHHIPQSSLHNGPTISHPLLHSTGSVLLLSMHVVGLEILCKSPALPPTF